MLLKGGRCTGRNHRTGELSQIKFLRLKFFQEVDGLLPFVEGFSVCLETLFKFSAISRPSEEAETIVQPSGDAYEGEEEDLGGHFREEKKNTSHTIAVTPAQTARVSE